MRAVRGIGRRLPGDHQAETCADELAGGDAEESHNEDVSKLAGIGARPAECIESTADRCDAPGRRPGELSGPGNRQAPLCRSEWLHDAALRFHGGDDVDVSHDLGGLGRVERRFHGGLVVEVDDPDRD